jgi:hypothetical protein
MDPISKPCVSNIPETMDNMNRNVVTCISDYRQAFGVDDCIYCTLYTHTVRDYKQYSAIADLHTSQFTITHALGLSGFVNRILAMDLSQSHCNFKSHMKSSWRNLIPFLPFLQLPIPKTWLDCSWPLFCTPLRLLTVPFYNPSAQTPWKTSSSVVKDVCLLVRYLAMDVLLSRARVLWECVYRVIA